MLNHISMAEVPRLSAEDAKEMWDSGQALFVDVRKHEYFHRLHIDGAVSVPMKGPATRFFDLPRDRDIIIY